MSTETQTQSQNPAHIFDSKAVYSKQEAWEKLKISRVTLLEIIKANNLQMVRIGRQQHLLGSSLNSYLEANLLGGDV